MKFSIIISILSTLSLSLAVPIYPTVGFATLSLQSVTGWINASIPIHNLTVYPPSYPLELWGARLNSVTGGDLAPNATYCQCFTDAAGQYAWGGSFGLGQYISWSNFSDTYGPASVAAYLCGSSVEIQAWLGDRYRK
ncbi:MAG: hypothetical protein M1834_000102 [Cirrosporium novae-zelandiae]|nr:MAG: hypothetical protein M1834_000102 [Cirrosporium novae-zelandiae]